jgi:hypothetical protein
VCFEGQCYSGDQPLADAGAPASDAGTTDGGGQGGGCQSALGLTAWLALAVLRRRRSRP